LVIKKLNPTQQQKNTKKPKEYRFSANKQINRHQLHYSVKNDRMLLEQSFTACTLGDGS